MAYFKLAGIPLLDMPSGLRLEHGESIAGRLGEMLDVLHASPGERWVDLVDTDDQPLSEAAQMFTAVAERVPTAHSQRVKAFLEASLPRDRDALVFSHNDLGIEHVLIDPVAWTVTGVIDWSDAALVDPARDFGLLYRDLGEAALGAALSRYRADDVAELRERAVFHGRCAVFEDLAYGIQTGQDRYVEKCLTAMKWLFPA